MSCSMQPDEAENTQPSSFIIADWTPLDELSHAFADLGAEATNALALQAVGSAFIALAFEASAHKHYTLASHGLWGHVPSTVVQGLDQSLADLQEAIRQWGAVAQWLEGLAQQELAYLESLRLYFDPLIQDHVLHLWNVQRRLQHERESMQARLTEPTLSPHEQEGLR